MSSIQKARKADILILVATPTEYNIVLELDTLDTWKPDSDNLDYEYFWREETRSDGSKLKIALAKTPDMGGDATVWRGTTLVEWLKPWCVAMVGICAADEEGGLNLGDVVACSSALRLDKGKLVGAPAKWKEIRLEKEPEPYPIDQAWKIELERFVKSDHSWRKAIKTERPLSARYQTEWLLWQVYEYTHHKVKHPIFLDANERRAHCPNYQEIFRDLWKSHHLDSNSPYGLTKKGLKHVRNLMNLRGSPFVPSPDEPEPKAEVAMIGTTNYVIAVDGIFPNLKAFWYRKLKALDMEAASLGFVKRLSRVPHWLVVKGVSDHGTPQKTDLFQRYATDAAYQFLKAFLLEADCVSLAKLDAETQTHFGLDLDVETLVANYRQAYRKGTLREAYRWAIRARRVSSKDPEAARAYLTMLLRAGRLGEFTGVLRTAYAREVNSAGLKVLEAECLWRSGQLDDAIALLKKLEPNTYNAAYLRGMCHLSQYAKNPSDRTALDNSIHWLGEAYKVQPNHWWVTLNFAIAQKVSEANFKDMAARAAEQLERAVQRFPAKASAKIYRLLHCILVEELDRLKKLVEQDIAECKNSLLVPKDIYDGVQKHIELLFAAGDPAKNAALVQLHTWFTSFDVFSADAD